MEKPEEGTVTFANPSLVTISVDKTLVTISDDKTQERDGEAFATSPRSPMQSKESAESSNQDSSEHHASMSKLLSRAVFGDAAGEEGEELTAEQELKREFFGLLHPDTPIRAAYDMLQVFIMLYLAYVLPKRLAFDKQATGAIAVFLDPLIDFSVYFDIYLNRHMYSYDSKTQKLITDRERIKKDYMSGWFFIDFFSVFPLDHCLLVAGVIMVDNAESDAVLMWGFRLQGWSVMARMLRLLRLVRLAKLKQLLQADKMVHRIYSVVKKAGFTKLQVAFYFRVAFLVASILAAAHFLGCLWLLIGRRAVIHRENPVGWMVTLYGQDDGAGGISINKTKDFIMCIGRESFDQEKYNSHHGSSCNKRMCAPIPESNPYDVDCGWIISKNEVGGTGDDNGVGAAESTQYLSAFYFALVTVATVGCALALISPYCDCRQ